MTIRDTSIDAGNAPLQENLGNSTIAVPLVLLEGVSVVLRMMERMLVNPRFCQEMVEADLAPDVRRMQQHVEQLAATFSVGEAHGPEPSAGEDSPPPEELGYSSPPYRAKPGYSWMLVSDETRLSWSERGKQGAQKRWEGHTAKRPGLGRSGLFRRSNPGYSKPDGGGE